MRHFRIHILLCALCPFCAFFFIPSAFAYSPLTYRYGHELFVLDPDAYPSWSGRRETWMYEGNAIAPITELLVEGDTNTALPLGVVRSVERRWDAAAIAGTIDRIIAETIDRPARDVTIRKSSTGAITFEGKGLLGRRVRSGEAAQMTIAAIENGVADIALPVDEIQPAVTVDDAELVKLGIKEIVSVGESDFSRSPVPRRHNIAVGLAKFNGTLTPADATFSFNAILGQVNAATGYWKELVILGEHTLPEYGGGLCQVSTTAYRGAWEFGFPIEKRRNHSFVVSYYSPKGTDATIYPPNADMQFTNDSGHALLLQTYSEGNRAYFVYYGTRDRRTVALFGPFISGAKEPPPDREEFTTDIPPGTRRKVGDRHAGMNVVWWRIITPEHGEPLLERYYSPYEARPLFHQIGVAPEDMPVKESVVPEEL